MVKTAILVKLGGFRITATNGIKTSVFNVGFKAHPHPKFYFCHRKSNLNETFRVDVSWAGHVVIKTSAC